MVAGYQLDFLLESGIKGELYSARQTVSGRYCRIRILTADKECSQRFLDEAKIAAVLFHPAVIDVYEAGSLGDDAYFVVAEEPDGKPLREVLHTTGTLPLLTSIRVIRQVAEALHAIHLKGLLHRSVSPENIILTAVDTEEPEARIQGIDLGGLIEHSIISDKFLIDTALDSLRYFAPEQCGAEPAGVQTDVYGLGVVFYEMLAGRPPFEATKATGLIEKHRNERPPEVKIDDFELRMLVTHALMESLNKRPERRQSSANAFARQLRHIEQLATHISTPPPVVTVRPSQSKPVTSTAAAPALAIDTTVSAVETPKQGPVEHEIVHEPVPLYAIESEIVPAPAHSYEVVSATLPEPFQAEGKPIHSVQRKSVLVNESTIEYLPKTNEATRKELIIDNLVPVVTKFVNEKIVPAVSHFSRLKLRRKKQQPETGHSVPPIIESDSRAAIEPGQAVSIQTASPAAPVQAEPAKSVPRPKPVKIEWVQPDDDIPSMDDVMEVLAKENTVEAPFAQMAEIPVSPPETEPVVKSTEEPEVLALNQEEPKEEPVLHAEARLPVDPRVESIQLAESIAVPVMSEDEPVISAEPNESTIDHAEQREPAIVGEQPKEPVVSKEDPVYLAETEKLPVKRGEQPVRPTERIEMAVQTEEQPILHAKPIEQPVHETKSEEKSVRVDELTERAVEQKVKPILRAEPIVPPVRPKERPIIHAGVLTQPAKPKGLIIHRAKPNLPPVRHEEPEEITLVRPRRMTIPIQTAAEPKVHQRRAPGKWILPRTTGEVVFFPTILGDVEKPMPVDPKSKSTLFSNYHPALQHNISAPRRSIIIGGGLMALLALFLFGDDLVGKFSLSGSSGDSVAAKTTLINETAPKSGLASPASTSEKKPVKNFSDPKPSADNDRAKPRAATERSPLPDAKSQAAAVTTEVVKSSPALSRPAASRDIAKRKPKTELRDNSVDKQSFPTGDKTAGATRPRIVKNPKP